MIKRHEFNYNLSLEVYEECSDFLEVKQCYVNIFKTLTRYVPNFLTGEWKIAYGYIKVLHDHPMMARHCFIVNENGEAIDPTFFTYKRSSREKEYYSFFVYGNIEEYLDAVGKNKNMPDLLTPLMDIDMKYADAWAKENEYILIR